MKIIVATIALIALCSTALSAADWPEFRGLDANYISKEKLPNIDWNTKPPKMVWSTALSDIGYSGPSVVKGRIYIIDHVGDQDIVRCINLMTGVDIWKTSYPNAGAADYGFTRATPTVKNGRVYTLNRWGLVVCLEAATGKILWTRDTFADYKGFISQWGHGASVLVDNKQLVVVPGGENACVVALDVDTGKTIWQGGGSDISAWSTPVLATINGKRQYVVFSASQLTGLDTKTGETIWQHEYKTPQKGNMASPLIFDNRVLVTASYNMGAAMVQINPDQSTGVIWRNKAFLSLFTTPVFVEGYVYGVAEPQNLICVDPGDGTIKWAQPGFEKGPIISVGGYLIAMAGDTGKVVLIKPDSSRYIELGTIPGLGGQSWTAPVFSNGLLLVRNQKMLACYDLK